MRRLLRGSIFFLLFVGFLAIAVPARAMSIRADDHIILKESEKVDGTLVVTGNTIEIDSPVDGDVVCIGQTVKITGSVTGDILCAAQSITITGDVGGSVRTMSQTLQFEGGVEHNVTSIAQTATFGDNSLVQGEFSVWAKDLTLAGQVLGGVYGGAQDMVVRGAIDKGIFATVRRLTIAEKAIVHGDVRYTSDRDAEIAAGTVQGKVERTPAPKSERQKQEQKRDSIGSNEWIARVFRAIVIHTILGILLLALFPKFVTSVRKEMLGGYGRSVWWGFLASIGIPVGLVLLVLTIIGIPFSIVGFLAFFLFMAIARVVTALHLGMRILRVGEDEEGKKLFGALLVGVSVLWLSFYIPVFGWLTSILSLWLGMGAIVRAILATRTR